MNDVRKIVVADDDSNILDLMKESLTDAGFNVIPADNGLSAFIKAKEEHPGLLILDLYLPRMDGVKVCQKLKSSDETKDIPILIVSAHTKKEIVVQLLRLGVNHFIAKPFDVDKLIARVNELYPDRVPSSHLAKLKIKYMPNLDILNIKLVGELGQNDTPILLNDITGRVSQNIHKIILNVMDLDTFGMEQVNVLEDIKDHFQENQIKFKITAGSTKDLRTNLLQNSKLKENLILY